jgi:hypothetical protein
MYHNPDEFSQVDSSNRQFMSVLVSDILRSKRWLMLVASVESKPGGLVSPERFGGWNTGCTTGSSKHYSFKMSFAGLVNRWSRCFFQNTFAFKYTERRGVAISASYSQQPKTNYEGKIV